MSDHWEALPAAALFVVLLLIGGGVIIGTIRRSRNERGALATILDVVPGRLGLRVTGRNDWQVEGKLEELSVRLEHRSHDDWSRVEVMVGDYGQVPMSLFLHKRGSYRESAYQPEQAWRTGDAAFDERVVLYGDRRDVAAAITPRARERLLHVVGELDCWIQNSSVYCEFDDARVDADALVERVPVMGDLIRDLAVPESGVERLASLLPEETCPEMAGLMAEVLFTRHPRGKRSLRAAEALVDHPSARARLFA